MKVTKAMVDALAKLEDPSEPNYPWSIHKSTREALLRRQLIFHGKDRDGCSVLWLERAGRCVLSAYHLGMQAGRAEEFGRKAGPL